MSNAQFLTILIIVSGISVRITPGYYQLSHLGQILADTLIIIINISGYFLATWILSFFGL